MAAGGVRYEAAEHRAPIRRWLRRNPFLSAGVGSFAFLLVLLAVELPQDSPLLRGLALLWQTLGFGPHLVANLLARHAPSLPGWLDVALIVVLGLLPYAAADALLARRRAGRRPSS